MLPDFYKISQENFETNLKYFYITNNKIKYSHQNLNKFKEYTIDYCLKVSKLFKEEHNNLNDSEIVNADYILINNDDDKIDKIGEKSNFLFPVDNSIKRLNNFFDKLVLYLTNFVKNLEKQLKVIEQFLPITKIEASSIKDEFEKQKEIFKSKFNQFQILNNDLKEIYYKGEKKLIDFCHEIKLDGIAYESNATISFSDIVQEQKSILSQYNSLGNYEKEFYDSTNDKINSIQYLISTLFLNYENLSKNILPIFNTQVLSPMNKFEDQNKDLESDLKKDLNFLSNNFKKNIDENNIKLKLDEYNIKVLENNKIKIDKIPEDKKEKEKHKKKDKKEKNEKIPNNINNNNSTDEIFILTDEEIYFIVQNMYQEYDLINKSKYDLKIEAKKLELKQLIMKLLKYGNKIKLLNKLKENKDPEIKRSENNSNNEQKEITKEEIDYLCKEMSNEEFRKYFLKQINNFRALGNLEMPEKIFSYFVQIFSEISKHLFTFEKIEGKKGYINDFNSSKLIIILSQTFYIIKNKEKIYISEELKNIEVFHEPEFWKLIISSMIEKECKSLLENKKLTDKNKIKNLKEEIYLAQIIPYIESMKGFRLSKEEIKNIILDIIKDYDISEETSKNIMDVIGV